MARILLRVYMGICTEDLFVIGSVTIPLALIKAKVILKSRKPVRNVTWPGQRHVAIHHEV